MNIKGKITTLFMLSVFYALGGYTQIVKLDTLTNEHFTVAYDSIFNETVVNVFYAESSGYRYIFDSNSNCIAEGSFVNFLEHGTWIEHYPNGNIKSFSNFVYGVQIGLYVEYWENGNLKESGLMDIENPNDSVNIEDLFMDIIVTPTEDESGVVVTASPRKSCKRGVWMSYSESGDDIQREFWKEGKRQ